MSQRTDIVNLNINVNGDNARKQLNDLGKEAASLRHEMRQFAKSSPEYKQKAAELKVIEDRMSALRKEIGVTAMSQKELTAELRKLKNMKNVIDPQTKEFKDLQRQIDKVQGRLKEVRTGKFGFKGFINDIKGELGKAGTILVGYLGFDFITGQAKNLIKLQAEMSKEYANIQKTTSLSKDQVKELDEQLRKLDTPTSNSRLRQMAAEAGKLGEDGVENLKEFVENLDKIQVALGEDLGDEGLIKIAKLSGILKEEMLNIASGINAVGAASAASESYQVDFAFRMAGTAQTAKLAAGDLLGYAAALEVNGQTAEVSGTAMSTFMLDFISKAEEMGAAAGMAQGALSSMINEKGVNEAFLTWLQAMKDASPTTDQFVRNMKDIGIDGARGAGVFLVLANNLEEVRKQQSLANEAVSTGQSVLDEFAIRSQSFDAVVQRLSKSFNSFFTSDAINNGVKSLVFALEAFLRLVQRISAFVQQNSGILKVWAATLTIVLGLHNRLVAYLGQAILGVNGLTIATIKNEIAQRASAAAALLLASAKQLLTGRVKDATSSFKNLWGILGKNPWLALIAVVTSAVLIFRAARDAFSKTKEELTSLDTVQKKVNQEMAETINKEQIYLAILKDRNASESTKKKALQDLIAINPAYLSALNKENVLQAQGIQIIKDYNKALRRKIEMQAAAANTERAYNELVNIKATKQQAEYIQGKINAGQTVSWSELPEELKAAYKKSGGSWGGSLATGLAGLVGGDLLNASVGNNQLSMITSQLNKELKSKSDAYTAAVQMNTQTVNKNTKEYTESLMKQKQYVQELENDTRTNKNFLKAQKDKLAAMEAEGKTYGEEPKYTMPSNMTGGDFAPSVSSSGAGRSSRSSGASAADKEKERLEQIREKIKQINNEVAKLSAEAAKDQKAINEAEIQAIKDKYAKLLEEAKGFSTEIAELTDLEQKELNAKLLEQSKAQKQEEYQTLTEQTATYYQQEKLAADLQYSQGLLSRKDYLEKIKSLDTEELQTRIENADKYKSEVEQATKDAETAKSDLAKKGVEDRNAIIENAARNEKATIERRAALSLRGTQEYVEAHKALLQQQYEEEVAKGEMTAEELITLREQMYAKMDELDTDYWQELIGKISQSLEMIGQAFEDVMNILNNRDRARLQKSEERTERNKEHLQKQLDAKAISQAEYNRKIELLDEKLDKQKQELAIKQAKREKAIRYYQALTSTAAAVAGQLAMNPVGPWNIPMAIAMGVLGAIQIATIASEPLPKARKGMVLQGPSHDAGGVNLYDKSGQPVIEAEGGEVAMLLSKQTYASNKSVVDELMHHSLYKNGARLRARWYDELPTPINSQSVTTAMRSSNNSVGISEGDAAILQLLTEMNYYNKSMVAEQSATRKAMQYIGEKPAKVLFSDIQNAGNLYNIARQKSSLRKK